MKCFLIYFKRRVSIITVLLFVLMTSCVDRYEKMQKYQRPDVLNGKIFDLISDQEPGKMDLFAQMLMDTKIDSLINKTGTYAVFAPNDSAMRLYLQKKYGTTDLSQVPLASKDSIVKYHILQMPWNKEQLQSLSSAGWITPDDPTNDEPTAFKRKTIFKSDNKVYKIKRQFIDGSYEDIILQSGEGEDRIVYNDVPKYAPLFFDDFLAASDLSGADYSFYFNRPYEAGNIYYANAKVLGDEQFAENGFLYEIDDVVDVLPNAEEILLSGKYSTFLDLIYTYARFTENEKATNNQVGVDEGLEVPTLYSLNYPTSFLNIHSETVHSSNWSVEKNLGLIIPTNEAMDDFFATFFSTQGIYNSWDDVPYNLKSIIVVNHIGQKTLYKKDLEEGFFTLRGDVVNYDLNDINETVFGSNCSFVGGNKVLEPIAFNKVSAPLLLDINYSFFFNAIMRDDLLDALTKSPSTFSFFMKTNESFVRDSSLVLEEEDGRTFLKTYDDDRRLIGIGTEYKLSTKLYGHIGIEPMLNNGATKEFIETIDGRHIVVYKQDGKNLISGGAPSQYGYGSNTSDTIYNQYEAYDNSKFKVNNGDNYSCDGWLNFTQDNLRLLIEGTKFNSLLERVGLNNTDNPGKLDRKERYTLFLPSDAALDSAENLSNEELSNLLKFHIIVGDFIFTDGRANSGSYRTYNGQTINIETGVDMISIMDENNQLYYKIPYSDDANQIAARVPNTKSTNYRTNVVVHPIDTVIYPY